MPAAAVVHCPLHLDAFPDIIDVRSPAEFAHDHLPGALNLPVLDDAQRREIGTLYRINPFEARRLGAAYVNAAMARHLTGPLVDRPASFAPLVYCWRGGLRSRSFAHVLGEVGWRVHFLSGGYKAFRRQVLAELNTLPSTLSLRVLAGLTGTGKTRILHQLEKAGHQVLHLEALANHRGSILGAEPDQPQPTQKTFETRLWSTLRALDPDRPTFVEAESSRIGTLHLPAPLWEALTRAPLTQLQLPLAARCHLLLEDYQHLRENPHRLLTLLDSFRPLRGSAQVQRWQHLIHTGAWESFLKSILRDHYDLAYRAPGSLDSPYPAPRQILTLPTTPGPGVPAPPELLRDSP